MVPKMEQSSKIDMEEAKIEWFKGAKLNITKTV